MKAARRRGQLQRGYQGQFQGSGKRRCWKDEADALRTINVNTGNIYCHYKMHALTSFYVSATDGVETFDEYYFSSLSLFSGAADVSWKDAKRKQKGCRRRLTNDNWHGLSVACICCRLTPYTRKVHLIKRFCAV